MGFNSAFKGLNK